MPVLHILLSVLALLISAINGIAIEGFKLPMLARDIVAPRGNDDNIKFCGILTIAESGFVEPMNGTVKTHYCLNSDAGEHWRTVYNRNCGLCVIWA